MEIKTSPPIPPDQNIHEKPFDSKVSKVTDFFILSSIPKSVSKHLPLSPDHKIWVFGRVAIKDMSPLLRQRFEEKRITQGDIIKVHISEVTSQGVRLRSISEALEASPPPPISLDPSPQQPHSVDALTQESVTQGDIIKVHISEVRSQGVRFRSISEELEASPPPPIATDPSPITQDQQDHALILEIKSARLRARSAQEERWLSEHLSALKALMSSLQQQALEVEARLAELQRR